MATKALSALRDTFSAILLEEEAQISRYMTEQRGRWPGQALAVARPRSLMEAATLMGEAYRAGLSIIPQGGNTGLVGGQTRQGETILVISTELLRERAEVDTCGNTMTLSSGYTLAEAQQLAERHNRLYPLRLASEGSCQVGGNLSTNAGGTQVLAYGNVRDLVLGLEVILPDGRIINGLRPLRKDNGGYDLANLFIGAEGTLGLITAAVVKLFPIPRHQVTLMMGADQAGEVFDFFIRMRDRFAPLLTAAELLPRAGIDMVVQHFSDCRPLPIDRAWYGLFELSAPLSLEEEVLDFVAAQPEAEVTIVAQNSAQSQTFWRLRHLLSEAQAREGISLKHDISLPLPRLVDFIAEGEALMVHLMGGGQPVIFGHMGDGNLHFNLSCAREMTADEFRSREKDVQEGVYDLVLAYGGSIAAEHGVGQAKSGRLCKTRSADEIRLYRQIKAMIDPDNLMNPGVILP